MKKKLAIMLLTAMAMFLVACGGQDDTNNDSTVNTESSVEESKEDVEPTPAPESGETENNGETENDGETENNGDAETTTSGALEFINSIWAAYAEEEKFPVGGGDSENLSFEGPAAFDVTKTEELDNTLGFPAAQADKIDDAASMMNAMMANNFTAGIYHVTNADDVQAVADAIKENIMNREWMCGFPEKLLVVSVDNYVVSVYGLGEFLDVFETKLTEVYENASILYEETLEF